MTGVRLPSLAHTRTHTHAPGTGAPARKAVAPAPPPEVRGGGGRRRGAAAAVLPVPGVPARGPRAAASATAAAALAAVQARLEPPPQEVAAVERQPLLQEEGEAVSCAALGAHKTRGGGAQRTFNSSAVFSSTTALPEGRPVDRSVIMKTSRMWQPGTPASKNRATIDTPRSDWYAVSECALRRILRSTSVARKLRFAQKSLKGGRVGKSSNDEGAGELAESGADAAGGGTSAAVTGPRDSFASLAPPARAARKFNTSNREYHCTDAVLTWAARSLRDVCPGAIKINTECHVLTGFEELQGPSREPGIRRGLAITRKSKPHTPATQAAALKVS